MKRLITAARDLLTLRDDFQAIKKMVEGMKLDNINVYAKVILCAKQVENIAIQVGQLRKEGRILMSELDNLGAKVTALEVAEAKFLNDAADLLTQFKAVSENLAAGQNQDDEIKAIEARIDALTANVTAADATMPAASTAPASSDTPATPADPSAAPEAAPSEPAPEASPSEAPPSDTSTDATTAGTAPSTSSPDSAPAAAPDAPAADGGSASS